VIFPYLEKRIELVNIIKRDFKYQLINIPLKKIFYLKYFRLFTVSLFGLY